jgi:hypothetical protein
MDIAAVFGGAWNLYKRNVGWLIIAGIIAAVLSGGIVMLSAALGGAIGHATSSGLSAGGTSPGFSMVGALGGIMLTVAVGYLIAQLVVLVLEAGMLKMTIDSARGGRPAQLGELFAGFSRLPAYLGFGLIAGLAVPAGCALVLAAVGRVAALLILPAVPCVMVFLIWLYVTWVYALPLIADRGAGPIEALTRSRAMVARVGWLSTFVCLLLLGLATWAVSFVVTLVAGRSGVVGVPALVLMELLVMPFGVCYLATMYLGAEAAPAAPQYVAPGAGGFDPNGAWPAPSVPPAPFAPAVAGYAAPAPYGPATGGYSPVPPPPPPDRTSESAAWASAADPLAQHVAPPAPSAPPAPTRPPGAPDPSWLSE